MAHSSKDHVTGSALARERDHFHFVVDGHVHLYSEKNALSCVRKAFQKLLAQADDSGPLSLMPTLFVLDTSKYGVFSRIYRASPEAGDSGFVRAGDEYGLLVICDGKVEGMLVGGVQIAALEGFEVLAIGCDFPIQDGRAANDLVSEISAAGGVPVLPWAFGKWLGSRGKKVSSVLGDDEGRSVLLGDNALRPNLTPQPDQFRLAREIRRPILPGSDPLPISGDSRRIGSFGFELDAPWSASEPVSSLLNELKQVHHQPRTLGRRLGWLASILTQLRIRTTKPHVDNPTTA